MQALRTLPILNRPSRPSSPAPPSTHITHVNGTTQQPSLPANGELKARSRSLSRHLSDKINPTLVESTGIPPNGLHINAIGKKGPSPPTSRVATPRLAQNGLPETQPKGVAPATGYMDVLGLRLNEAVNKASAGIDYKSKKGFKKGAGWQVGEAIVKEMPFPPNDAYLIRAVLRTAVKTLSIYISRLESLLLPALTDPAFAAALNTTHVGPSSHPLNPSQHFAVSVAHAAWETCEVLEQTLETGQWPKFVQETLRPVMDKLDLVVGKVTQPLLISLKRDLVASLGKTEGVSPPGGKILGLASVPNPTVSGPNVPLAKEHSNPPISRLGKEPSDRGYSRSLAIPTCLQHFASRVDGARKVLEIVAAPCADDGEAWITNVVVAVVWKGMCVSSEREITGVNGNGNGPPSPSSVSKALLSLGKEKDATPAVVASPSASASAGVNANASGHQTLSSIPVSLSVAKLTNPLSILPSRSASRAPSPPRGQHGSKLDVSTHALMSLEGLVKRLVTGLVQPPLAPGTIISPSDPNATEHLAREALFEAQEALTSFRIASSAISGPNGSTRLLHALRRIRDDVDLEEEEALDDALEDMPAVTLWRVLIRQANYALSLLPTPLQEKAEDEGAGLGLGIKSVYEIWGWSGKAEYDRQVLNGFGSAEDWARRVAQAIKPEVERVLGILVRGVAAGVAPGGAGEKGVQGPSKEVLEAVEWVRAVGVAIEARTGIKVGLSTTTATI